MLRRVIAPSIAVLLGACSPPMAQTSLLTPAYLDATGTESKLKQVVTGVPYYLPKTLLPLSVTGEFVPIRDLGKDDVNKPEMYEYVITVKASNTVQVADATAPVFLEYKPDEFSDDKFNFTVNDKGLLTTSKFTSTDRTKDVLLKLVELASTAMKLAAGFPTPEAAMAEAVLEDPDLRRKACRMALKPFSLDWRVDISTPLSAEGEATVPLHDLNARIVDLMQRTPGALDDLSANIVRIDLRVLESVVSGTLPQAKLGANQAGIVFRVPEPVDLSVGLDASGIASVPQKVGDSFVVCTLAGVTQSASGISVIAMHPKKTFSEDLGRGTLVAKTVNLTVTDGVLLGVEVDKPSEALALVSLPVDLLKAIVAIPAELFTFKIQQLQKEQGLTQAEADLLKAQVMLLQQQQLLEQERAKVAQ